MALRMLGALIGCGLGLASVIFVMPYMTTIAHLSLMIGIVSFVAAWISLSSERLSYAGLQIAMAFFFCTLVGFSPSIDHIEARDRIIGILFGLCTVFVVFSSLWPVSTFVDVRKRLAAALDKLSRILTMAADTPESEAKQLDDLVIELKADLAHARRVSFLEHFEGGAARRSEPVNITAAMVDDVQDLLAPAIILARGSTSGSKRVCGDYGRSLADWLTRAAKHLRSPTITEAPPPAGEIVPRMENSGEPEAGPPSSACADWWRTLAARLRVLDARLRQE